MMLDIHDFKLVVYEGTECGATAKSILTRAIMAQVLQCVMERNMSTYEIGTHNFCKERRNQSDVK